VKQWRGLHAAAEAHLPETAAVLTLVGGKIVYDANLMPARQGPAK
jgi:hypothetical protein